MADIQLIHTDKKKFHSSLFILILSNIDKDILFSAFQNGTIKGESGDGHRWPWTDVKSESCCKFS